MKVIISFLIHFLWLPKILVRYITVCLFVCLLGVFRPIWEISLIWRRHHYWWRAANFVICSALMAIEQWGFLRVLHLLLHGPFVYNDYLLLRLIKNCIGRDSNTQPFDSNALTNCAAAVGLYSLNMLMLRRNELWRIQKNLVFPYFELIWKLQKLKIINLHILYNGI